MLRPIVFLLALVALTWVLTPRDGNGPGRAPDAALSGRARVVDGDTFWIGRTKIRVFGIDAPEAADPLGAAATAWLRERLAGQTVACVKRDIDRYGRIVATCRVGGRDIAAEMVAAGMARAYRRFSLDYLGAEARAQAAEVGIWSDAAVIPATAPASPGGCAIKGNISASGMIYHMPGTRIYPQVRVDVTKGERWFCSEAEARAAGWRPVKGN